MVPNLGVRREGVLVGDFHGLAGGFGEQLRRGHHFRPLGVDAGINAECRGVNRVLAFDDFTAAIDENQVGYTDLSEMNAEWIDPEAVVKLGIAAGDVTGYAFVESEFGEE